MTERSRLAGDLSYLRDRQYATSDRLAARAALHANYSTATVPWFGWVIAHFELRPHTTVLEVGCGAGWLWAETAHPIPDGIALTLCDLSPGMVDEAVERLTSTSKLAAVTGHPADAHHLPFDDATFDRVIANHMLYHLADPNQGVEQLARVVTDDGVAVRRRFDATGSMRVTKDTGCFLCTGPRR